MKKPAAGPRGFSMVEVTLALGIVAFCILPIVGLLGVGFTSNQASVRETAAATVATAISDDLRATPLTATASPYFGLQIPASGATATISNLFVQDDGLMLSAPSSSHPTYLATVVVTPASSGSLSADVVRILITWPALANQANGSVPVQYAGSFETIIGLDRN
jgi:uncharacterized protein (TIGR02598 family)